MSIVCSTGANGSCSHCHFGVISSGRATVHGLCRLVLTSLIVDCAERLAKPFSQWSVDDLKERLNFGFFRESGRFIYMIL